MKKILIGLFLLLFTFSISYSQDLHKYSTQEVLNIVLNDPASAINFHHYSTQEVFNIALDETNSALKAKVEGISIDVAGRIVVDGLVVIDPTSLGSEVLDENDFATSFIWVPNGDWLIAGGVAAYKWVSNTTSLLEHADGDFHIPGVADVYYKFTYTVVSTTAFDSDGAVTITTTFARTAVSLDITSGTHTVYFRSASVPTDFIISVVSGTDNVGEFSIDDVTLKQITGGRVDIAADLWVNGVDIIAAIAAGSDDQKIDEFSGAGNTISISLEDDGEAAQTLDISGFTAIAANTAKVTDDDDGVDGVYGAGWNTDTDSPEKDDIYDYLHVIDTDDDGDVDNFDPTALAAAETDPNALLTAGTDNVTDLHLDFGTGGNQISAVDIPIADGGGIIAGTEVETALQENRTAIDLNTSKNTNVPTELALAAPTATTVPINSDGSSPDITLIEATTTTAGLLGADKWNEIVANTIKDTNTDDQKIDVFSIDGDNVKLSLEDDGEVDKVVDISTTTTVTANKAHITADGSSHTFIDQSVISGATPTFSADNFSDGGSNAIITTTQETNFEAAYSHVSNSGTDHSLLGATAGTATASKALIVDSNKDIDLDTGDLTATEITVTGDFKTQGYNRKATILFQDDFDFWTHIGYSNAWDITSLKDGAGLNDITSNVSHITLTTDGEGAGESEGTRSNYTMVSRARKNRTEFQFELSQTANTNYYMGWNDNDEENAMVSNEDKYVIVYYEVGTDTDWQIKVGDGTDEEVIDTEVTVTTDVTVIEIWTEIDGTVHLVIDGVTINVSTFTNKMATDAHYLIVGQIETTEGTAVTAQIGYVENEKFKAH